MNYSIVEIKEFSGSHAHIYTIRKKGASKTLLDEFFEENKGVYDEELRKIAYKLRAMGRVTGCQDTYFRIGEGKLGDGVCAIRMGRLRLYCIRYGNATLVVGSGGEKPEGVRSYQELPYLNAKAQEVRDISEDLYRKVLDGDLRFAEDGEIIINEESYEED